MTRKHGGKGSAILLKEELKVQRYMREQTPRRPIIVKAKARGIVKAKARGSGVLLLSATFINFLQ